MISRGDYRKEIEMDREELHEDLIDLGDASIETKGVIHPLTDEFDQRYPDMALTE